MPLKRTRIAPVSYLLAATLAIVCFFVAATWYSQRVLARLDADAASIAGNASPSIEALAAARGDVRDAEVSVVRALEASPVDASRERETAKAALAQLRSHQSEYLGLPFYPNERSQWDRVGVATRAFERAVGGCLDELARQERSEARGCVVSELRPATEELDRALGQLVAFNALEQHRMGLEIPKLRRRAARIAYVLDGASAALAIALVLLVVAEFRRRERAVARQSARLEQIASATLHITGAIAQDGRLRPVLEAIVAEAGRLVEAEYTAVGIGANPDRPFDPFVFHGMHEPVAQSLGHFPRPIGVLGSVVHGDRPVRVADVTRHPSFGGLPPGHPPMGPFLGLPIRREGHGAGNLYVARSPGGRPFTAEDEHVLQLLAAQAAVSIENARLYQALGEQRRRAEILADASARMVGSLDYETTLSAVAGAALPAFADVCILRVVEAGDAVRSVMSTADPAWRSVVNELMLRFNRPRDLHPVRRVLRERRPLVFPVTGELLDEVAETPEHRALLDQLPVRQGLSVPLLGRAGALGALTFLAFREDAFCDDDVGFAEELARRAALSIDNALLHEGTRRAVRARDDLLAIVAHDLRSPLTSILLSTELLKRASASERKRVEGAERVTRVAKGMLRLIEDLLDASKIESGTFAVDLEPQRTAALVANALDLFHESAAARNIALAAQLDRDIPPVLCDRDRVLQVLSNLVGNALKFTPEGGTVSVAVIASAGEVRFAVCDGGPGIPPADRQHIFDRYWQAHQTRRAGAGLGLFIVKGIVEAHGGRVWAEEAPGGGGCLCFTLKRAPALPAIDAPACH